LLISFLFEEDSTDTVSVDGFQSLIIRKQQEVHPDLLSGDTYKSMVIEVVLSKDTNHQRQQLAIHFFFDTRTNKSGGITVVKAIRHQEKPFKSKLLLSKCQ
jgi:hypothetical protein